MLLNKNNINLLIDFDSTFVTLESLDVISQLSLQNNKNKISKIMQITNKAMVGEIPFSEALNQRIEIINASKKHINKATDILKKNISVSFINHINFLKENSKNIFIISGGFKEIIFPIVKKFNIKYEHIFANEFLFDKQNNIYGINKNNPLSNDKGKVEVAKQICGKNIIIGDGYTDYEVKKYNAADFFIQFVETVNRKNINNNADLIANNFDDVIKFINKISVNVKK